MIPACRGTSIDNPSEQTTSGSAAEYNIRYEVQLVPYFRDHRSVAVPKNLIIVGGNENPACIMEIRFRCHTRRGHSRHVRIRIGRNGSFGPL